MPEIEIPEIREIAPPLPPDTGWPLIVWILLGLIAFVFAATIIYLLCRPSKSKPITNDYDARSSALTKLHHLKETYLNLPATEFALAASHGLREYLTSFYGSTTPFETGREFLSRQDQHGLMNPQKFAVVSELYQRAENLKYAPSPGADSQRLDLVQDMIQFVRDDVPGVQLQTNNPTATDADPVPA